jgi:uncharacterized protein
MTSTNSFLGLSASDEVLFKKILNTIPYAMSAYGSRVKGNYKKLSDIDLCIMEDVDDLTLFDIKEQFSDSDLPMKVDIKRWSDINSDFQDLIRSDFRKLK